jgi:hypothetical protein
MSAKLTTMIKNIKDRELATILAALRYWQRDLIDDKEFVSDLSPDEIDDLCEKLNFNDKKQYQASL